MGHTVLVAPVPPCPHEYVMMPQPPEALAVKVAQAPGQTMVGDTLTSATNGVKTPGTVNEKVGV